MSNIHSNIFFGGFRSLSWSFLFFIAVSAIFSCTKTDIGFQSSTVDLPGVTADKGSAEDRKQLDKSAFTDRPAGAKEVLGTTLYEYGIYYQDTHEPYDLIAPELREAVRQHHIAMTQRYGNIADLHTLAAELERDQLVPEKQNLNFYVDFVDHLSRQPFTSFGQFWFYLKTLEQTIQSSNDYNAWQKELLTNYCVLARHTMKYGYAQGKVFTQQDDGASVAEREGCDETKCTLKEIGIEVLWGSIKGPKGAIVGFLKGLVKAIFKCDCYDSECAPPLRYRIAFNNCNLTTQNIIFMGQGPKVTSFTWFLVNGTAAEFGGGSTGTTSTPSLTITQTDPNIEVDIFLTYTCNDKPYLHTYRIDIRREVEGGTAWIEGPSPITVGSEVMYAIAGTCLANPFNTNYHINVLNDTGYEVGTVTTNSGTSCVIRWNYMSPETHGDEWWGNVVGGFTNQCVNANRGVSKQVIITRSGIGQSN